MVDVNALRGLPLAALWCVYGRAAAAERQIRARDHVAMDALERLAFPCAEWFGAPPTLPVQRAAAFDRLIARWAIDHPAGTVVSLGDGLDTGFWRHDNGALRWLSIELGPIVALRGRVLPRDPRQLDLCASAFDTPRWFPRVDPAPGIFVLASGLLSYFDVTESQALVVAIARRFPWAELAFDVAPRSAGAPTWCAGTAGAGELRWRPCAHELSRLRSWHPNVAECTRVDVCPAAQACGTILRQRRPPLRPALTTLVHVRCRPAAVHRVVEPEVHLDGDAAWAAE